MATNPRVLKDCFVSVNGTNISQYCSAATVESTFKELDTTTFGGNTASSPRVSATPRSPSRRSQDTSAPWTGSSSRRPVRRHVRRLGQGVEPPTSTTNHLIRGTPRCSGSTRLVARSATP